MEPEIQDLLIQLRSSDYRVYRDILYVFPMTNSPGEPFGLTSAARIADELRNRGRSYDDLMVMEALSNMEQATASVMESRDGGPLYLPTEFGRKVIQALHPSGQYEEGRLKPFPGPTTVRRVG